jgi:hypothetical protein
MKARDGLLVAENGVDLVALGDGLAGPLCCRDWSTRWRLRDISGQLRKADRLGSELLLISSVAKDEVHATEAGSERDLLGVFGLEQQGDHVDADRLACGVGMNLLSRGEDDDVLQDGCGAGRGDWSVR